MSCPTPTTPTSWPWESMRGVAFSSSSIWRPCFVSSGSSKLAVPSPWSALLKTSCTDFLNSLQMNSSTKSCPIISSLPNPVIVAAFWFHSLTFPLTSMPKMGALAVSISFCKSFAIVSSCFSATLRSVISCPTPTTPTTFPLASRRVAAFKRTSMRSPVLVYNGNSKLPVSRPARASSSTILTEFLNSSLMKSSTRPRPITSSLPKPVISTAFWFHSFTCP
mmetsp:Transcript_95828/g.165162  ORF Transcript_95828/g.165162 Transcript_95828/m.165162 type:complete len:221 (+) Transcript_95828:3469-4131(+)